MVGKSSMPKHRLATTSNLHVEKSNPDLYPPRRHGEVGCGNRLAIERLAILDKQAVQQGCMGKASQLPNSAESLTAYADASARSPPKGAARTAGAAWPTSAHHGNQRPCAHAITLRWNLEACGAERQALCAGLPTGLAIAYHRDAPKLCLFGDNQAVTWAVKTRPRTSSQHTYLPRAPIDGFLALHPKNKIRIEWIPGRADIYWDMTSQALQL